jgi:aminocarboxymuconate-semialdehyde decarboxylase
VPIDTHAHYVPPQLIAAIKSKGKEIGVTLAPADSGKEALQFSYGFKVRPFFPMLVEPVAQRHKWMDEQRIDHQINGTWPDIFAYGLPREHCIAWHRMLNDTLAEWTADNATRFPWISSVPLIDDEAAAAELERTINAGAVGVIISANIENVNIGELPLDPFWRKAEALGLPVLIHPVNVAPAPRTGKFALAQIALYTYDTTLGVGSLLMSGVMDRFPKLEVNLPHAGGTFPWLIGRWDHGAKVRPELKHMKEPPSSYLRRFTYDTIGHDDRINANLVRLVGADRVTLGSDYCFDMGLDDPMATVNRIAGVSAEDKERICGGNARKLLRL